MITVTDQAVAKIQDILLEENNPALKLRVFVQGGGCSGMQYGFTLDDTQNEDDWDLEISGVKVLVDSMSGLSGRMVRSRHMRCSPLRFAKRGGGATLWLSLLSKMAL